MKQFSKYFDHTLLKPEATKEQIKKLCDEAREYDFYSVCVNGCHVSFASKQLKGTDVKVAAVVGFPLGAMSSEVKAYETMKCCEDGASEIDMVMNIGAMKEKDYIYVASDIASVVETASKYGAAVKVILETCLLTNEEISKACKIAADAGATFVKTSTGFSTRGASAAHVKLMKNRIAGRAQVKASGGIRDLKTVQEMIKAGADRIGASASVAIIKEYEELQNKAGE